MTDGNNYRFERNVHIKVTGRSIATESTGGHRKTQSRLYNHGKHGRHGIKKARTQFFRAFRVFRGSNIR